MTVYVNLVGGLGNQMFQYACGRAVSLNHNVPLKLVVDMFDGYDLHHGLELTRVFAIDAGIASADDISSVLGWRKYPTIRRSIAKLGWPLLAPPGFIAERSVGFYEEVFHTPKTAYLHGYWQSSLYFERYASSIRSDFRFAGRLDPDNERLAREMEHALSVSVHVRRGDYVSSRRNRSIYAACTPDYYLRAMDVVLSRCPSAQFFAFSDDPSWVKEVLCKEVPNITVVGHNRGRNSHVDMRLMSTCKHHIIANSTFSWWGAWLGGNSEKMVVAPKRWFAAEIDRDIVPRSWTRI